jgi:hypothetical protein
MAGHYSFNGLLEVTRDPERESNIRSALSAESSVYDGGGGCDFDKGLMQ